MVLGSGDGGHLTQLAVAPPCVSRFNPTRSNKHVAFSLGDRVASTDAR